MQGEQRPPAGDPLELMEAAILERERAAHDGAEHRARHERLAWLGQAADARCDVHGHARHVVADQLALARVHADAELDAERARGTVDREGASQSSGRWACKRRQEAVAHRLDLPAAELGDGRWRDLLARHDEKLREELSRFGGREVKTIGDGFLATFAGPPSRALRCALAITNATRELGVEVRIGVHTGECELIGDDVGGMAVHLASRVTDLAGPGEVLVSGTVFGTVVGGPFAFEDRGFRELKGVPGRWPLFALGG